MPNDFDPADLEIDFSNEAMYGWTAPTTARVIPDGDPVQVRAESRNPVAPSLCEKVARALDISPILEDEEYKDGHAHLYVAALLGNGKLGWFRVTKSPVHFMNMRDLVKREWAKSPGIKMTVSPRMPKAVAA